MAMTGVIIKQIIIMFLLIISGFVCFKIGLLDKDTNQKLSSLVLKFINPALIISSYQIEFKMEYLAGLGWTFLFAMITMLLSIFISKIVVREREGCDNAVERFSIIYSNSGFMGIPLVNSMLGATGVFYLTAYITAFTLMVWTHGVMLMKKEKSSGSFLNVVKAPAFIAMLIGLLLFVFRIPLPSVINSALKYIGDMNTPLPMIVSGATIAQTNMAKSFLKPRAYLVSLYRLLVIPVAIVLILMLFHIEGTVFYTVVIAAACPAAAMGTLFAVNYGRDYLYASELFVVTTLLSIVTLPLVFLLANLLSTFKIGFSL